jgi:hypothetical protein
MAAAPSADAPATCAATRPVVSSGMRYTRAAAPAAASRPAVLRSPGVPLQGRESSHRGGSSR